MSGYAPIVTALCRDCGWPVPVAEYRFDPTRRWRFDLAWPDHRLAVEIEGGLFTSGRHVQGAALIREYEKLNAATLAGWAVLLVVPRQVTTGALSALLGAYFARQVILTALLVVVASTVSLSAQEPLPVLVLSVSALEELKQPPAPSPPARPMDFTVPIVAYVSAVSGAWAAAAATCVENSCPTVTPTLPTMSDARKALGIGLLIQGTALWTIHRWVAPRWPRVAQGLLYSLGTMHAVAAANHVTTSRRRTKGTL